MRSKLTIERSPTPFRSITEEIEKRGLEYHYKILELKIIEASRIISEKLGIPLATKVVSYKKLRIIDNYPRTVEQIYIDSEKVPGLVDMDLEDKSLYKTYKDVYGYEVVKTEEDIRIVKANDEELELLDLDPGSEILLSSGLTYIGEYLPLEYFQIKAVPDFFKFRSLEKKNG